MTTDLNLLLHIGAGIITLLTGPMALVYHNKADKHRLVGKIFFYAMLIVVLTSFVGFFRHYHQIFFQFILGIALLVAYNISRGVRAIYLMKGKSQLGLFEKLLPGVGIVIGCIMIGFGGYHLAFSQVMIAIPILFFVFGILAILDGVRFRRVLKRQLSAKRWLIVHVDSMFGAFIASNTAFLVNSAHFLPWYIQWFLPTILLVPIQIYIKNQRQLNKV